MKKYIAIGFTAALLVLNSCSKEESIQQSTAANNISNLAKGNTGKSDMCVNGNTISVNNHAVVPHLKAGHTLGTCDNPVTTEQALADAGIGAFEIDKNHAADTDPLFTSLSQDVQDEFKSNISTSVEMKNGHVGYIFTSKTSAKRTLIFATEENQVSAFIITKQGNNILSQNAYDMTVSYDINWKHEYNPRAADCPDMGPQEVGETSGACVVRNYQAIIWRPWLIVGYTLSPTIYDYAIIDGCTK